MLKFILLCAMMKTSAQYELDLVDIGLKSDNMDVITCYENSRVVEYAGYEVIDPNVTLLIPEGDFCLLPVHFVNLDMLHIKIMGNIHASNHWSLSNGVIEYTNWSHTKLDGNDYDPLIWIENSEDINIQGGGRIDGNGYSWWWNELLGTLEYKRPDLIHSYNSHYITISSKLYLSNSPHSHISLKHVTNVVIHDISIWVDWRSQQRFLYGNILNLPMFPFNTDGIDISGKNVSIQHIFVENADDVVAVKAISGDEDLQCTENITIEDVNTYIGVGLSIGSVVPHKAGNCVRNITFRNANMFYPLKTVYIKSNSAPPGADLYGIIENVLYMVRSPLLMHVLYMVTRHI